VCRVLSQTRGIYKPMEDVTGKQRQWLSRIVSFALQLALENGTSSATGFALDIIYAIVLVEHRDIQDHLSTIWSLVWKGVLGPGSHVHRDPSSGSSQTSATQLAVALVQAHADLRQLEAMFDSLASSIQSIGPVHMPIQFCRACREAIASAPSAQSVSFVRMIGRWIESSGLSPLEDVSRLGYVCLSSVNCQLMTAPGIADACVQLIHALRACLGQGMDSLTPSIVSLYTEAVRLHRACGDLHPNVIPLKGQQVGQFENGAQFDNGGFFSALFSKDTRDMMVWEHIRQWEIESLVAAALHLQTLHQRILRAQHDCCNPDAHQTEGTGGISKRSSVFNETGIEEARYLARMVIGHAGRRAGRATDEDKPRSFEMVYPLYKILDVDDVEAYALVSGCDQDVPGLPVPTRMAINLLLQEPSLMEAIAFEPFRLCDLKELHAVAYNLVGRFIASDIDQDQEISRYRLACFPERDLTVSVAVGRWMHLVLR
jgi:hypothetical protein